jgi:ABC-type glycerol-3-phosphate transport system substrate-binding protein
MTGTPVSRRTLVKAAGLAAAATPLTAGCAGDLRQVEVFVIWSGQELSTFNQILGPFRAAHGLHVNVVALGEQMDELIRARFDADNPPDVVITPRPGTMMPYASRGRIASLNQLLGSSTNQDLLPGLQDVVTEGDNVYGLWVKATHKSLFWYRQSTLAMERTPQTWSELVDLTRRLVERKHLTPLSVGAADGWTLTDWFENVLIGAGGGTVYDQLARGQNQWDSTVVVDALTALAELWSVPNVFPFGPARALLTQCDESVTQVFGGRHADMVFEGDFVEGIIGSLKKDADLYGWFLFPPSKEFLTSKESHPPPVIGGDVAMLPTRPNGAPSEGGLRLVQWLADPNVFAPWIDRGGFLSPYRSISSSRYQSSLGTRLADQLQHAGKVYFDLSDQLRGRLGGGAQGRGLARILQEFFAAVSTPGSDPGVAVRQAQDQLVEAARLSSPR